MRRLIRILLPIGAGVVAACSILVHPYGDVKHRGSEAALVNDATVDTAVRKVVSKSCTNCHSEATEWPWYSYVAPMSWLIEGDVYDARKHMNLSHWDDYSIDQKQALLSEIAVMVRNQKMPPSRYLFLHPEAKLTDADVDQLYQWARNERRRLKKLVEDTPSTSSGASQ